MNNRTNPTTILAGSIEGGTGVDGGGLIGVVGGLTWIAVFFIDIYDLYIAHSIHNIVRFGVPVYVTLIHHGEIVSNADKTYLYQFDVPEHHLIIYKSP